MNMNVCVCVYVYVRDARRKNGEPSQDDACGSKEGNQLMRMRGWVGDNTYPCFPPGRGKKTPFPCANPVLPSSCRNRNGHLENRRRERVEKNSVNGGKERTFGGLEPTGRATRLSSASTGDVATTTLGSLVGGDGSSDGNGKAVETERAKHVLGVGVHLEAAGSRGVESRDLGNVLVLALTLLFLKLERDTANGTTLDTLHEVGGETGNLVAKTLGRDNGNLVDNTLVLVEVDVRETRVVLLDEDARSTLGSLGANSTLLKSWKM